MGALVNQIRWLKALSEYNDMAFSIGRYDDKIDYVGKTNDWKSRFIPRKFYGVDINVCAYIHDYYYGVGGNATDRFKADAMFLADIMKQIELKPDNKFYGTNWYRKHLARLRAVKYFEAVRTFGGKAFTFTEDKWAGIK